MRDKNIRKHIKGDPYMEYRLRWSIDRMNSKREEWIEDYIRLYPDSVRELFFATIQCAMEDFRSVLDRLYTSSTEREDGDVLIYPDCYEFIILEQSRIEGICRRNREWLSTAKELVDDVFKDKIEEGS